MTDLHLQCSVFSRCLHKGALFHSFLAYIVMQLEWSYQLLLDHLKTLIFWSQWYLRMEVTHNKTDIVLLQICQNRKKFNSSPSTGLDVIQPCCLISAPSSFPFCHTPCIVLANLLSDLCLNHRIFRSFLLMPAYDVFGSPRFVDFLPIRVIGHFIFRHRSYFCPD